MLTLMETVLEVQKNFVEYFGLVKPGKLNIAPKSSEQAELESPSKLGNNFQTEKQENGGRKMSESDGDLLEICLKPRSPVTNKILLDIGTF